MRSFLIMQVLLRRENSFALFRNLNKAILNCYITLKNRYEAAPPPNSQITNALKTWKDPLEAAITQEILRITKEQQLPEGLSQAAILAKLVDNYKEQQEFILFRNFNSSIETIKDFIRTHAMKHTSKDSSGNQK